MSPNVLFPIVVAPLIVWRLYYRMRRNFGRQPIRTKRMWTRVVSLSVVALLVATQGFVDPRLAGGLGAGLIGGVVLGMVALKLTRFEIDGSNDCYFPNPWIGLALTALLIGRLLYKLMVIWPATSPAVAGGYGQWHRSSLTLAILGLLLGYYIAYYAGLLIHHRRTLAMQSATAHPRPARPS